MGKYGASSGGEFDTEFSARNIMSLAMRRVGGSCGAIYGLLCERWMITMNASYTASE